jgi:MoaA/NifB/PqqE/SkfB family radical SAM enzyme
MHIKFRDIDIEVTNRCNATCDFCPREMTPKQGFMAFDVFEQSVKRIKELNLGENLRVSITGLGEPTLHPRLVDCVKHLADNGITPAVTSNGSRLTPELIERLLDAGLKKMVLSVSDLHERYNKIYGLDFDKVLPCIDDFIARSRGRCFVQITVVKHQDNQDYVDDVVKFWEQRGVDYVHLMREENRAGSHDVLFNFQKDDRYRQEAMDTLHEKGLTDICSAPFYGVFIGWAGQYNLCCMDWEKKVPLGNVFDHSIHDVDLKKLAYVERHQGICADCSMNPVNDLREVFYEVEQGIRGPFAIANKTKGLCNGRSRQREMKEALDDMGYVPRIIAHQS